MNCIRCGNRFCEGEFMSPCRGGYLCETCPGGTQGRTVHHKQPFSLRVFIHEAWEILSLLGVIGIAILIMAVMEMRSL